jgi:hypothetical protein
MPLYVGGDGRLCDLQKMRGLAHPRQMHQPLFQPGHVGPTGKRRSPPAALGAAAAAGIRNHAEARLRPEHAEAILGIVEGDPLDEAGEHFLSRWLRTGPHADCQNIPSYLSARSCDIASRTRQQP